METTIVCWAYKGITERNMETTVACWGLYRDNGKEHGTYYVSGALHFAGQTWNLQGALLPQDIFSKGV